MALWNGRLYVVGGSNVHNGGGQVTVYSSGVSNYAAAGSYFNAIDFGADTAGTLNWASAANSGTLAVSVSTAASYTGFGRWAR